MKRFNIITVICLALMIQCAPGKAQLEESSVLTDILHYSISVNISDKYDSIYCETGIKLKALKNFHTFKLDLEGRKTNGRGMRVLEVSKDNKKLNFQQASRQLEIQDTVELKTGDTATYLIRYGGIPSDGIIISKNKFGRRTFFADNWPERARCWIPCNDFPSDKATVDYCITAPSHYLVVANGRLTGKSNAGVEALSWKWKEEVPISTKVMVFGAANFSVKTDSSNSNLPVESWVYEENKIQGWFDYSPSIGIVDSFIRIIGAFPYEKLANVQSTTIYGGMENASCIFYAENSVTGNGKDESLLSHEIAHQWFGNSVTEQDWSHLWLSEGFATFFANVYFEKRFGPDTLHSRLIDERTEAMNWPGILSVAVIPAKKINPRFQLNPVTYQKAGWILSMLRSEMGDSAFFKGIRSYYSHFANKTANTDNFRRIMEKFYGKDLNQFFSQWLYIAGFPDLEIKWHFETEKKTLTISVNQKQKDLYTIPLGIGIIGSASTLYLKLDRRKENFTFRLDQSPKGLVADPEIKLFARFSLSEY